MKALSKPAALGAGVLAAVALASPAAAADSDAQALAAAGTGSAVSAAAWQVCASAAVAGVGGVADNADSNVLGSCDNSQIQLFTDTTSPALANAIADTALVAAPWQACGSDTVYGVGGTIGLQAAHAVTGDCNNANITIDARARYVENDKATFVKKFKAAHAATRQAAPRTASTAEQPQTLASAGSGTAVLAAPWQVCGSAAVAGVGGVIPLQSVHDVDGNCANGNVHIVQDDPTAVVSALDSTVITAASWQVCGSDTVAGVGGNISVGSPNVVYGNCSNANITID